jgi:histidinol-phosphatase (PHP family)
MSKADFHVHTTFCDGAEAPEAMVRAALEQGLSAVGFSGHSHTAFDESWCMSVAGTARYRAELARLKREYAGRIAVFCGVEQIFTPIADGRLRLRHRLGALSAPRG